MVLPVSGFLPVPLPMMIPFMGAQSLVIGKMFGEGFQYGKRHISAMTNEQFNKLTFADMMSNARRDLQQAIPSMKESMNDMDQMVEVIIDKFVGYLEKVIIKAPEALGQIGSAVAASGLAGPVGLGVDVGIKTVKAGMSQLQMLAYAKYIIAQQQGGYKVSPPTFDAGKYSTIPGLTVGMARQQAKDKQLKYEQEQREFKRAREGIIKQYSAYGLVPQIPLGWRRRKAGQSQKMNRSSTMKAIAREGQNLKTQMKLVPTTSVKANMRAIHLRMRRSQQRLINLLAMWDFS